MCVCHCLIYRTRNLQQGQRGRLAQVRTRVLPKLSCVKVSIKPETDGRGGERGGNNSRVNKAYIEGVSVVQILSTPDATGDVRCILWYTAVYCHVLEDIYNALLLIFFVYSTM